MRHLFLIILLVACAGTVSAGFYKWTDEKGRVHYSDKPKDADSTAVTTTKHPPSVPKRSNNDRLQKQKKLLNVYAQERAKKQEEQAKARQEKKKRERNCAIARDQQRSAANASALYTIGKDGKRNYLSNKQRAKEEALAKKRVAKWCK